MLLVVEVEIIWNVLYEVGVVFCGFGVCDMLCLEVGMNFYGQDMDEMVFLFDVGLVWMVLLNIECDFVGKVVLVVSGQQK